jgi:hypothetical protein
MRTTLNIEDDVLAAAKELARSRGTSAGHVVSQLLRNALSGVSGEGETTDAEPVVVAGFRPFQAERLLLVTNELIDRLRDQEGL